MLYLLNSVEKCAGGTVFLLLRAVFKHTTIIQELSKMFMKLLSIGLFKYQISPSMFLLMEPLFSEI